MIAASRSLTAAGSALLGAGLIASSTIAPMHVAAPRLSDVAVQLQASVLDIFTFPALQQSIANEVEFVAIRAVGLAESGAGLAESFAALPETLITAAQQTLSGDVLGALTTLEDAAVGAAEAVLIPYVGAQIEVGQIQLAIQSALLLAQPVAAIELGAGLFNAFDGVARALITAGQNFVDAVLSFNIGDIITSLVDGVTGVVTSIGVAGQDAVDGIVAAQTTLADALATRPAPPVEAAALAEAPLAPSSLATASVAPAAAAVPQRAAATVQPVDVPAAAPAKAAIPTAIEVGADLAVSAPAAVAAAATAAVPAPPATSVRAAQRAAAGSANASDAASKKPAAKRATRSGSAG